MSERAGKQARETSYPRRASGRGYGLFALALHSAAKHSTAQRGAGPKLRNGTVTVSVQ